MKTLITGVAGFIGSNLAEELVKQGHEVIGIDCFTKYYDPALKKRNISNLLKDEKFRLIERDLLDVDLAKLLKNVDTVFHEAAQPGVRNSWGADFSDYVRNNILTMQALLEASKAASLKHLVYASSSSIYGDAESYPTSENTIPQPVSPYGVTKLACENLCNAYIKNYDVPIVTLRYFTVYGPRQRPDMAFNKFIRAALRNERLTIYGDGLQTRDFTFVKDIVNANILVLNSELRNGIFNIGGGSRTTLKNVIDTIGSLVETKLDVEYVAPQKGDVRHTSADISCAEKILGYKPQVTLKDGLKQEVKWLRAELSTTN